MEDTDISIPSASLVLRGSLAGAGEVAGPAALLISGSGPLDRNSNSEQLDIDVMARIAKRLAANGVASLRYDKRGVGESDGDFLTAGFHDNVADARAALAALLARPEVDPDRVVIVGHSEGALIAAALADDERLAGVALLAGPARNGREVLRWQGHQLATALPTSGRRLAKVVRTDVEKTQANRIERIANSTDDVIRIRFARVNARWFREFMAFEPATALQRAVVPVLAITGNKDIQVDPSDVARMERVVPTPFTGHVVDDLTHLLRSEPGPPTFATYEEQGKRPLADDVVDRLTNWLLTLQDGLGGEPGV